MSYFGRMKVNHQNSVKCFDTGHGERVFELVGHVASAPTPQHSVALIEIEPGKSSQRYHHPEAEESYFVLEGEARMVVGEESRVLKPGDCVLISPRESHQIFNDHQEPLKYLAICSPAWKVEDSVFE